MKDLTWGDVVFVAMVCTLVIVFDRVADYPPFVKVPPAIKGNSFDCSLQLRETLTTHCVYRSVS